MKPFNFIWVIALIYVATSTGNAQWTNTSNRVYLNDSTFLLGIGTSLPNSSYKVDIHTRNNNPIVINGKSNNTTATWIRLEDGNAKTMYFGVYGGNGFLEGPNGGRFDLQKYGGGPIHTTAKSLTIGDSYWNSGTYPSNGIAVQGNLLVGKTSQTNSAYKVDVAGGLRADSVIVNTTGADFVFSDAYKLPSLDATEAYISVNKHLPGVPSAEEMKKEGVSVGALQTILLQKIEELTLYVIKLNKENRELKKQVKK